METGATGNRRYNRTVASLPYSSSGARRVTEVAPAAAVTPTGSDRHARREGGEQRDHDPQQGFTLATETALALLASDVPPTPGVTPAGSTTGSGYPKAAGDLGNSPAVPGSGKVRRTV